MSDANAIELRDVVKRFGEIHAVDHVSLQIRDGEFFSMLGPSGCGKTTTLRMIAGFEYPTSGSISIHGREMATIPPHQRPVNTVFQSYALFPHMTVEQNVAFGLEMKRLARAEIGPRVKEALEMVRLGGFAERRPRQMSGGQQQRVALARALVNHPEVLLLDEPLGALDQKLRKEMQLELKSLQHRVGITFIFVTHDQEEALTMSDRIAVMTQGRVDQIGSPTEIYHRPATAFVAGFIGTANLLPVTVRSQNGDQVTVDSRTGNQFQVPAGGHEHADGSEATLMVRPERLVPAGAPLHGDTPAGRLECTVTSMVFQGPVVRCQVRTVTGTDLVAHLGPEDDPGAISVGSPITMTWAYEGAYLVPEAIAADMAGVSQADDALAS